ncbi:MAG: carboxyl transferase domain-containing protein, partial [Mycobacterium sp.]
MTKPGTTAEAASNIDDVSPDARVDALRERIRQGGAETRKAELRARGSLLVRERLERLLDPGFVIEDWILARHDDPALPADGVVTVVGHIVGQQVAVMANDMSVKAGTWGVKTVRKIQRIQQVALDYQIPMIYLVDSGGARISEQYGLYLDRDHSGRIFWNMARMNGVVPQVCVNFGPSPAGAAYLPAFCDLVVMIDGRTSVYLGSPRQAAAATGEQVDDEQMGGARMHCSESGLGDVLVDTEDAALDVVKEYLAVMPANWAERPTDRDAVEPAGDAALLESMIPSD